MTSTATAPTGPLWQRARASFARAIVAIGAPAAIAAIELLTRQMRRAIVERLFLLEHVVRKLLLAEAAEISRIERARAGRGPCISVVQLPVPPARRLQAERSSRTPRADDLSRPETWRVQFSFGEPRDTHRVPEARAPRIRALWGPTPPPPLEPERKPRVCNEADAPLRLARRLEALRRVLENPLPHAARLGRILDRALKRCSDVVRRFVFAPQRGNGHDSADDRLGIDAISLCIASTEVLPNSS